MTMNYLFLLNIQVVCVDLDGDKGAYRCDCKSDKYAQVEAAKCIGNNLMLLCYFSFEYKRSTTTTFNN